MSKKKLVIVESPAKIKTLQKFLGKDFAFESSIGHIRDLPQKEFGIDLENDFEPTYVTMPDKQEVINKLTKAAKNADVVYLAPDPDREGEAIAWHIAQILPKGTKTKRTSFNSITKNAVLEAIANPREIDHDLVEAQQTRRMLDRMVGYTISPLLTRRVKRGRSGTSAGRVQSVALKFVVDREKEIDAFKPVEYWTIRAFLSDDGHKPFESTLYSVDSKRVEKEKGTGFLINNEKTAQNLTERTKKAKFHVDKIEKKQKKRNSPPPFITSTLQQEASRHHGFSASKTMMIAQQLYEGIDMGKEGTEGLITYMRTDSFQIAPVAIEEARKMILSTYGKEYLPEKPHIYKSKKAAQEAHEAIRPTNLSHPPEVIKKHLSVEQLKLYTLIYRRFLASQMKAAIYDTVSLIIGTDQDLVFRASGSILKFRGYLAAYEEKTDISASDNESFSLIPEVKQGQELFLKEATKTQSFTKPPPRYTEASLVKELENSGIGRPSTYASIMNKIQSREYTTKEGKALVPTELGKVIAQMLEDNFALIMDANFTSGMEDELELIAEGKKNWKKLLKDFWKEFSPLIEKAERDAVVPKVLTDLECPKCKGKLEKIWSRSRYFYGCQNYPDCDYTTTEEALTFNKEDYDEKFDWDQKCPNCQSSMTLRHGRFGPFLGCSTYPECKGIINIPKKGEETLKPEDRPDCPAIGCDGKIMMRKSRFGKTFFSCSNYPDCDVIVNDLDQLSEKYPDHPKTAYVKKTKKKATKKTTKKTTKKATKKVATKTTRKMPSYRLSKEMADVCKTTNLTRAEVLKQIWVYIREHNCQDPKNKRMIVPDQKLAKVFKTDQPIDMMKIASLIKDHLIKE